MTVLEFEVVGDGVLRFAGAAMDAAAQLFFDEASEPAFHQVEPGRPEMKARCLAATLDGRGFVGGVIVDDQMERAAARDLVVKRLRKSGGDSEPFVSTFGPGNET